MMSYCLLWRLLRSRSMMTDRSKYPIWAALFGVILTLVYYVTYQKATGASSRLHWKMATDKARSHPLIDEIKHVSYLKVHKTGSSTVQNIFLRFVDSRNLTMVFPHVTGHPNSSLRCSNVISYTDTLTEKNMVPPPPGRQYDVLCCHVLFNKTVFERYLPNDTVYIGIVRDPFDRLESAFRFFALFKHINMSEFARNPLLYDKRGPSMANNRMAFEFGFPRNIFPTPQNPVIDKASVKSYLVNISREFDLILINERMEESLVYMRRLLRWTLEDIIFLRQKISKRKRRFTEADKLKLSTFLYLDIALYDYSVETFDIKFKQLGSDAENEASFFKGILDKVEHFCQDRTLDHILIEESNWSGPVNITQDKCSLYVLHEQKFVQKLREKTYGTGFN